MTMQNFYSQMENECGSGSLELQLIKSYVLKPEDISDFSQITIQLVDMDKQPMMNGIIYFIEDKVLDQMNDGCLMEAIEQAFDSVEGMLNLLRGFGIDGYNTYQFVADCWSDDMIQGFTSVFSGDLDELSSELCEYYDDCLAIAV